MTTAAMMTPLGRECADETGLMRRIAVGEAGALEALVKLYEARVRRLAGRLMGWNGDVEDVVQDVFLATMEKAGRFRGDASVWTWLTAVTLNRCRTYQRRSIVRARVLALLGMQCREQREQADRTVETNDVGERVRCAVAGLSRRDREVVVLFHLEQKPAAEIGELLGVSQNAVEVRLHRARARLRARLEPLLKE